MTTTRVGAHDRQTTLDALAAFEDRLVDVEDMVKALGSAGRWGAMAGSASLALALLVVLVVLLV